jgi:hypothetical protein
MDYTQARAILNDALQAKIKRRRTLARLPIEQKVAMVEQLREMAQKANRAVSSSKPTRST